MTSSPQSIERPLRVGAYAGYSRDNQLDASIEIGAYLQRLGDGWWLTIDGSETKAEIPIDCFWPTGRVDELDRYIDVHRPSLLAISPKRQASIDAVWISKHGTAMTTAAIAFQITSRTEAKFGEPMADPS
jgi:hypothetical protein